MFNLCFHILHTKEKHKEDYKSTLFAQGKSPRRHLISPSRHCETNSRFTQSEGLLEMMMCSWMMYNYDCLFCKRSLVFFLSLFALDMLAWPELRDNKREEKADAKFHKFPIKSMFMRC